MANEFIARKGLIALEDSQITGSLDISTSLTASNISVNGTGQFGDDITITSGSYNVETYDEGLRFYNGSNYTANKIKLTPAQNMQFTAGGSFQFSPSSGQLQLLQGKQIQFNNSANDGKIRMHNGAGSGGARLDFEDEDNNELMSISSSGNVGIGTTSPTEKLHVAGTISGSRIYGSGTNQKHLLMSTNTDAITEIKPSDTRSGLQSVLLYRNNNTGTANYLMAEGPTTRFATYDGGTPSDVSGMISIIPNNTNEAPKIAIGDAGSGDAQLTIGNNILLSNTGSVDSYINAGNVGIGTTSPSAKLHVSSSNDGVHIETQVAGASAPQLFIEGNKSVGSPSAATIVELKSNLDVRGRGILYTNGADSTEWYSGVPYQGGGYQIGYDSSGGQSEYKANSSLFINTSGNVGIGTTSPTEKLTVEGNISASGDVDIVGQLSINGFSDVSASLAAAVAGGDDLGNHTATQDLNMGGNAITSVGNVDGVDISTLNSNFNTLESKTLLSGSAQIASDISGAFTAGNGISLSSGQFTVAAGTGLTQNAGGLAFDADGGTLTTNNADVDHILINDGGTFKRITKGNINVGDFNNDAGYLTSSPFTAAGISGSFTAASASFSTRVTANDAKLTANTSNVTSAGALMDSEVTSLALIKGLTAAQISGAFDSVSASLASDIPTNNNQLTNGAGYITSYTVTSGDVTAHVGDIDHDSLLNFVANEHIDHSTITIGSGKGLSGGGTIDTNRSLTLNTGSTHFIDGAAEAINSASFSTRVTANDAKLTANTSNVQAAGALMDSEVTDLDGIKSLTVPNSTTISTFGASLVDDANAAAARTTLGVDASGTDNSTDVTLAGSLDYITISGQEITRNAIDLSTDVTGQIATSSITDFPTEVSRSAAAAGFGAGGGGGSGTVTEVTVGTGLDVTNGTTTPNITLDLSEVGFTGTSNGLITSDNDGTVTTESTLTYNGTLLTLDGTQRFTPGTANNGIMTRVDNQWESTTLESNGEFIQVGTAISRTAHQLYNLGSSGWVAADADAVSTSAGLLGVAVDGNSGNDFLIRGVFNIANASMTDGGIGKTVYVSTSPGVYTCTAPTATGDIVRAVGHIVDTFVSGRTTYYKVYFNPSPDYIEN